MTDSVNQPKVSVVIPVHNGEKYLEYAIQSMLAQSYLNLELVLVDDHSRDDSVEIAKAFSDKRVRVFRQPNQMGIAGALNWGIRHSTGSLIARMDQDDVSDQERVHRQVQFLERNPEVDFVGSYVKTIEKQPRILKSPVTHEKIRLEMLFSNPIFHPTVMFRRSLVEGLTPIYREEFEQAEDFDLWQRIVAYGRFAVIPEPLVEYRVHPGQMSSQNRALQKRLTAQIRARAFISVGFHPPGNGIHVDTFPWLVRVVAGSKNLRPALRYWLFRRLCKFILMALANRLSRRKHRAKERPVTNSSSS